MAAYYNENDAAAAHVLRDLIRRGVIAHGEVDERSIVDVRPDDLRGFVQCHFFAGGGLWSVAARLAGWPDDAPIWTGSCPCQPFSVAGKGLGRDDPRHLWPHFHRLIAAGRPHVVAGEQVSGAAGYDWIDGTSADLEREGYACEAFDIPACAIDAPHQRNRLYWVATRNVDDGERARLEGLGRHGDDRAGRSHQAGSTAEADGGAQSDANSCGCAGRPQSPQRGACERTAAERSSDELRNGTYWSDAEWIVSPIDGRARRAKPGIRFLADGLSGRVDLWRIGGNAIVPILAAEVLAALKDTMR